MGTRPAANMGTLPRGLWGMAWEVDAGQPSSEEHFFCTSLGALCAGSAQVTLFLSQDGVVMQVAHVPFWMSECFGLRCGWVGTLLA